MALSSHGPLPVARVPTKVASLPLGAGKCRRTVPAPLKSLLDVRSNTVFPCVETSESVIRRYPAARLALMEAASTTLPFTVVPRSSSVWPSITTGSTSTASNRSSARAVALEMGSCRRTDTVVPAGSCTPAGMTALDGEIPPSCGPRSKGSPPSVGAAPEMRLGGVASWPHARVAAIRIASKKALRSLQRIMHPCSSRRVRPTSCKEDANCKCCK